MGGADYKFENLNQCQMDIYNAILEADKELALNFISDWAKDRSYREAITELFDPILKVLGAEWVSGRISLAQSYVAGKLAEDVLNLALKNDEFIKLDSQLVRRAVIGNIEDDYHALGRKMVGSFLRAANWDVIDLGNDVPAEEFVSVAVKEKVRVIGTSAMMFTTAANIAGVREVLDKKNLSGKIMLAAGGAVFNLKQNLLSEVGGDGTCTTAMKAPELFASLYDSSAKSHQEF
jgi:methylmalonyl-CoA mutase cobalamin-binding domain/chain